MNNRSALLFSLFFCTAIGSVPLLQFVSELHDGGRIQAADLVVDMVFSPVARMGRIKKMAGEIDDSLAVRKSGTGSVWDYERAEDLLAKAEALKNQAVTINRYVTDSTGAMIPASDSLVAACERLRDGADAGDMAAVAVSSGEALRAVASLRRLGIVRGGAVTGFLKVVLRSVFRETLFNRKYLRTYEKELEDRSVCMLAMRPVMQVLRYALLGDAGVKALPGRDGWLFYRPGIEYLYRPSIYDPRSRNVDYNDKAITDDPVAVIADFRDQLAKRGIELMVMIVPGKGSIYPELFTGSVSPEMRSGISHTRSIIEELKKNEINVVDLFDPFLGERLNDPQTGDSMYLARDTHWRSRGLRCAAREVAAAVRLRPWFNDPHATVSCSLDTIEVDRFGDVGEMTGLPDVSLRGLRFSFKPEVTKCFPVLHNYLDSGGVVIKREPYRDDFKRSRILVLGDSFSRIYQTDAPRGAGWIAHLAYELSEPLGSMVSDGGASTLVREKLARKSGVLKGKRLVIWEFVERDMRYGAYGWKKVALP